MRSHWHAFAKESSHSVQKCQSDFRPSALRTITRQDVKWDGLAGSQQQTNDTTNHESATVRFSFFILVSSEWWWIVVVSLFCFVFLFWKLFIEWPFAGWPLKKSSGMRVINLIPIEWVPTTRSKNFTMANFHEAMVPAMTNETAGQVRPLLLLLIVTLFFSSHESFHGRVLAN